MDNSEVCIKSGGLAATVSATLEFQARQHPEPGAAGVYTALVGFPTLAISLEPPGTDTCLLTTSD